MSILRKILFPFSLIYWLITWMRNKMFDTGILKSMAFSTPVICVGNLSAGGTGKSPMVEFLLNYLLPDLKVATLSRGYGRTTSGYHLLKGSETASMVGDEPLQFKLKFRDAFVAVDENRQRGILNLQSKVSPDVILLDDALQHRKVKAGLNILLTSYGNLFTDDFILPTGNLREPAGGVKRSNIVVVTKCPPDLEVEEQEKIKNKLALEEHQHLFFSYIVYSEKIISNDHTLSINELTQKPVTLITGIANPKPLLDHLKSKGVNFEHLNYPDHHRFTDKDLQRFSKSRISFTTEKDYVRLKDITNLPELYYIPIEHKFLNGDSEFKDLIVKFINKK